MMQTSSRSTISQSSRSSTARTFAFGSAALMLAALSACNTGSTPSADQSEIGTILSDPDSTPNAAGLQYSFFVDSNVSGKAPELRIAQMNWGRLVDIYALFGDQSAPSEVLMQENFVIGSGIVSNLTKYELRRNAVTGQESLLIKRNVSLDTETEEHTNERDEFFELLRQSGELLTPIFDNTQGAAGFYTMVPRNATIVLTFDDLLDASLINSETVRVLTGIPSTLPFLARVLPDKNFGDLVDTNGDDIPEFFTSRILIDTTVSEVESFRSNPPLPVNTTGLPGSIDVNFSNIDIRIATQEEDAVGQETVLRNISGHALAIVENGSMDSGSTTIDIVRSVRAGGNAAVTADPFNGYLVDQDQPRILGMQSVRIFGDNGGLLRRLDSEDPTLRTFELPQVIFTSTACAQTPAVGDVIQQTGLFAEIISTPLAHVEGVLENVKVRLLVYPQEWDEATPSDPTLQWISTGSGAAQFISPYDPFTDEGQEFCYLRITPTPLQFPTSPAEGVLPDSTIGVRFSEPMDPSSITAFDTMTLTRVIEPDTNDDYVVGSVGLSLDLTEFTFEPSLPLNHTNTSAEVYFMNLGFSGDGARPTDLSGNALNGELKAVALELNGSTSTTLSSGRVSRFAAPDEEENQNPDPTQVGYPEFFGQHTYDIDRQLIRPRPVIRYDGVIDRNYPVTNLWTGWGNNNLEPPVQEPLSRLGSRLQTVWRNVDMNFELGDETNYNIDVEGLAWAPLGGQVISDFYGEFEISLAHCTKVPDEYWIPPPFDIPGAPNSGLLSLFQSNLLDNANDPLTVVHPKFRGYTVTPGDKYQAQSGTVLMPFPLNRDLPLREYTYYTWRDTSLLARGGGDAPFTNGAGVNIHQYYIALGLPIPGFTGGTFEPDFDTGPYSKMAKAGDVQTVGLPLLMDFKTYPEDAAIGLNSFDVGLGGWRDPLPVFRAFSVGGQNSNGETVRIDPDLETSANGGFNPQGTPAGSELPGLDTKVYLGAVNFVVRVSRSFSVWFPVLTADGTSNFPNAVFQPPIVEPSAGNQPSGTAIQLSFRGALAVPGAAAPNNVSEVLENGRLIDSYGDFYYHDSNGPVPNWPPQYPHDHSSDFANVGISFLDSAGSWFDNISAIEGALYFQTRITFISNAESGQSPELSALGLAWGTEE